MKLKYFGTDGFRGKANEGLNVDHAFKIGRFVGWYYGARTDKKARIVLGKDTRRSSYMFESALVAGLVASGADARLPARWPSTRNSSSWMNRSRVWTRLPWRISSTSSPN